MISQKVSIPHYEKRIDLDKHFVSARKHFGIEPFSDWHMLVFLNKSFYLR